MHRARRASGSRAGRCGCLDQAVDVEHGDAPCAAARSGLPRSSPDDQPAMPVPAEPAPRNMKRSSSSSRPSRAARRKGRRAPRRPFPGCRRCSSRPGRDSGASSGWHRHPPKSSKWMQQAGNTSCTAGRTRRRSRRTRSARSARAAQTEIERVVEQALVVGAEIEHHRQQDLRRHGGARRIELPACRSGCPCRWRRDRRGRGCARRRSRR